MHVLSAARNAWDSAGEDLWAARAALALTAPLWNGVVGGGGEYKHEVMAAVGAAVPGRVSTGLGSARPRWSFSAPGQARGRHACRGWQLAALKWRAHECAAMTSTGHQPRLYQWAMPREL